MTSMCGRSCISVLNIFTCILMFEFVLSLDKSEENLNRQLSRVFFSDLCVFWLDVIISDFAS